MKSTDRITIRSVGQFGPKNWINEGGGLLASAKVVRKYWADYKETFRNSAREGKSDYWNSAPDRNLLTGLPRSSMLLLGYSVEMYLKAGLTKAYFGCSKEMFERDVKNRFGHKLVSLAREIDFPLNKGDEANLNCLKEMMLFDARYPVFVPEGQSYSDAVNQQTRRIWSIENFDTLYELAERVCDHTRAIDSDSNNSAEWGSWQIDQDGYLAFRDGGHLSPRITYRASSIQMETGATSFDDMKKLFASEKFWRLNSFWDRARIYEDRVTKKATTILIKPLME